jgi:NADH-quinone oxidoreductase subunit J
MFYVIASFILAGGLLAVTSRKIFRSAVWLLLSLTGIASLYFWLDMQFLAAVQIVVYIGGIAVLIIFSIFLTEHTGADLPAAIGWRKGLSAFLALAGFATICYVTSLQFFRPATSVFNSDIAIIGKKMLSTEMNGFALPFEAVSILLLAAMIGCIAIALRKNTDKI